MPCVLFSDSCITKALISAQVVQHRNYVPSDQEKGKYGQLKIPIELL